MFNLSSKPIIQHLALTRAIAIAIVITIAPAPTALASGGAGGSLSNNGGSPVPRKVDEVYEFGKALYLGRGPSSQKIRYCVLVDGAPKKLRLRNVRRYRSASQLDFANALYDCDNPEQRALLKIKKEEVAYVLYYLNKRYRLELK